MKIEILCTGDEILSGKTINTNYSYMARRLVENGFSVYWGTTVGDDRESLVQSFKQAAARAEVIIVNGGLGPTVDDLSQQVAAMASGVELELHEDWLNRISAWYTKRGRVMPENNTKQAMLPAGAELIDNPIGTACGFAVNIEEAVFYFTPGVPNEMRRMIDEQIIPRLQKRRGGEIVTRVKRFHTFGIGESRADKLLHDIEAMSEDGSVKLGFQSHYPQLETKLTSQAETVALLDRKMASIEQLLRERLGNFIVAEDEDTLEARISSEIEKCSGSLVVMETGTAGQIATRLMSVASTKSVVRSGLVAGNAQELARLNGCEISDDDMKSAAGSLASAAIKRNGVSHAMAVLTAVDEMSKDDGEAFSQNEYAWKIVLAISDGTRMEVRESKFPGSPQWIRIGATELALDCLRRFLTQLPIQQKIDFEQH